jgi:hypothetical protein
MTNQDIDQMIYDVALSEGFTPTSAKFVVAQARVETSVNGRDYTSPVFVANNNMYGMKFVGQPLATRGGIAPFDERSSSCKTGGVCKDSDHYAKYLSPRESALDTIQRNFNLTLGGVSPTQLKNASTPEEYARLLKLRGYYGASESFYAAAIKNRVLRVDVKLIDFYYKNKNKIDYALIGGIIIGLASYGYYLYKKGIILKKV